MIWLRVFAGLLAALAGIGACVLVILLLRDALA
jgi:hypothetical protein